MSKLNLIQKYGFISFFIYSSLSIAEVNKCNHLFTSNETTMNSVTLPKNIKFRQRYQLIKNHVLELLESDKLESILLTNVKPDWNDYNSLKNLIALIKDKPSERTNLIGYLDSAEIAQLQIEIQNLKSSLNEKLKIVGKKISESDYKFRYTRFLDYHIAYFRLLGEINQLTELDIFPLPNFNLIESDAVLISEAEKLISKLEQTTENTFLLSGHRNRKEFDKYITDYSPLAARRLKLVNDELVVSIHRPESARFWIPFAGFQNQRVTGSSNGSLFSDSTPEVASLRDSVEATLTQTGIDEYVKLSARFKPNYAEARPDVSVNDTRPNSGADQYGTDLWIIKKSVIEKRATWTPTDSLWPGKKVTRNRSFDDIFIPWKYRSMMVPFSIKASEKMVPNKIPSYFKFDNLHRWNYGSRYFEVQIFGPLTIDDIQAFHFQRQPPDKELYEILTSKGIEIWDERTWPAKKYYGNESK